MTGRSVSPDPTPEERMLREQLDQVKRDLGWP